MSDKKPHILVVEDSDNILEVITLMFDFQGWEVSTRTSLANIIADVKETKPDLILMDMLLSGANGCDACTTIKNDEEISNIPVMIMSAHPEAHREAKNAGANYFIAKPFEMDALISKVKQAIEA
ncbi:MAG: two-component system response regulator [Flavobacteriaceae bacterium]|nr:two-component system response regulator [Flavobacteriaceae bacterium]|tara:strand:+ start:2595 stop:2966 length:372 start_codon:yes stop_codon:yes gene_type:complete